jgi:hypothetical protein
MGGFNTIWPLPQTLLRQLWKGCLVTVMVCGHHVHLISPYVTFIHSVKNNVYKTNLHM